MAHDDPLLYHMQKLRDEAHRYVIGAHRQKRMKAIGQTKLDSMQGIGPARKKALLHHFGSAQAVSQAGVNDLTKVEGISLGMAEKIYEFFHESL